MDQRWRWVPWALAAATFGCHGSAAHDHGVANIPEVDAGPFQLADLKLAPLPDQNPDPQVLEVDLEARPASAAWLPGKPVMAWTYNGAVPGPLIEAKVGDRLIVHFHNALPEPTTIHWHGVRAPAAMDGSGMAGDQIAPGASFTYDFTLPDAGLFWYHPHVKTDRQVEQGLYGALVVRGNDTVAVPERILLLDDVLVDASGQQPATDAMTEMMGRVGNVPLVNGHPKAAISVRAGSWERWRLVNAANARILRLELPAAEMVQIGTDGGWLPGPMPTTQLQLVPGERADVLVRFTGAPGSEHHLRAAPYDRGHGMLAPAFEWMALRYTDEASVAQDDPTPQQWPTLAPLVVDGPTHTLALGEQMAMSGGVMQTTFTINGQAWPKVAPVNAKLGRTDLWKVSNTSDMPHPFHLHGFFFQPRARDGKSLPLAWKDTIDVPAKSTVELAVRYDDHAGMFAFHCHILEHGEAGMMGMLHVEP
jgi:FtsP/CotA-like multicopper oxidase with cupredoxin domain